MYCDFAFSNPFPLRQKKKESRHQMRLKPPPPLTLKPDLVVIFLAVELSTDLPSLVKR